MMNTLTIDIRQAEPSDAPSVASVHSQTWYHAYCGLIPHKPLRDIIECRDNAWWERVMSRSSAVLVIELGGDIVGYATIGKNRTLKLQAAGEIYELYILPEYQGMGLGTKLFNAARAMLKNNGLESFVVWALEDNTNALRFYDNHSGRDCAEGLETFGDQHINKIAFIWNNA